MGLLLATAVLMFTGSGVVGDLVGPGAAAVWRVARWPGAFLSALLFVTAAVGPLPIA